MREEKVGKVRGNRGEVGRLRGDKEGLRGKEWRGRERSERRKNKGNEGKGS